VITPILTQLGLKAVPCKRQLPVIVVDSLGLSAFQQ